VKKREQEQMDMLADRMQTDIAATAVAGLAAGAGGANNGASTIAVGQSLLGQLRAQRAVGRLVIDLPRMMHSRAGTVSGRHFA